MNKGIARWTTVKIALLRARHAHASAADIAAELGFTVRQVQFKTCALGLVKRPYWTAEQDNLLRTHYAELGSKRVAKMLDRSPKAVCARAAAIGLARRRVRLETEGRKRWPFDVVERARTLHERGYSYVSVSEALADEITPAPTWNTVREWCAMRCRATA